MAIGFDADLTTQFSVTAGPTKLIRRSAALSSTTSLNITGLRIKRSAVAVNTQFTANISGQKNVILGSTQTAVSSVTASLSRTKRFTSSLSAQATMAVTAKKIVRGITAMASASSLTADAKRLRGITSATASESQLTGQVIKTARANSTINAWVTEISVVNKIGRGLIGFDATTTMTVDAVKLTDIPIFLAANTDITAIGNNILYGDADLLAFTEQNSNVDYLRRNESNMTVSASMEAVNGRVRYNSAEFNVVTNSIVSTLFSRTRRFASVQTNTVNLVTNNQIVKLASATMSSQFTLLTIAGSVTRFTINMVVTGFQLSAGRIIHIDEYYQLAIPAETRFLKIIPESRLLEVNQETRVNKITGR
jgi:hypothetical protein